MRSEFLTGGGKHASVDFDFAFTAQPPHSQSFENAQQLGCVAEASRRSRRGTSAPVSLFKATRRTLHSSRKRAFSRGRIARSQSRLRVRGCIDRDKRPVQRGLHLWISRATNPSRWPLSPRINTGADVGATCLISEKICCIAGETPTRSPRTPRRLKSRFSSSFSCRLLLK